jgi:tRNA pseudouridine38-40 synthase
LAAQVTTAYTLCWACVRNFKLILAYDGAGFAGWQVQPGKPTIQGELANAIEELTGEKVLPQGSGRTDAGVHGLGQVASVALQTVIPLENLWRALNHRLPATIRIVGAEEVPADFHARYCAQQKTYRYRIYRGDICSPFLANFVYHHPYPLDEACMLRATEAIVGEHDFTSFAAVDPEARDNPQPRSNVRTIYQSALRREGEELIYEVTGNGFLHHMVRNIVGMLLWIGKNSLPPEEMARVLAARDRSVAAATAPAQGLYLVSVQY